MQRHFMPAFSTSSILGVSGAVPVRDKFERRTTSSEFKNKMASIASSGHFTAEERLKAFRNARQKSDQR